MKCSAGIFAVVAVALVVCACGQKGPLVLPDAPKHKRTMPSAPGFGRPAASEPQTPAATPQQAPIDSSPTPPAPGSPTPQNPR